jgi:hypothetical protein
MVVVKTQANLLEVVTTAHTTSRLTSGLDRRQRWGSGASPILFEDFVIVNASDEAEAIIWLDKKTGEEKYRAEADGLANVWSTPIVIASKAGHEIAINHK